MPWRMASSFQGLGDTRAAQQMLNLAEIIVRTYYSAGFMQACR
jgi:hypothetical protein